MKGCVEPLRILVCSPEALKLETAELVHHWSCVSADGAPCVLSSVEEGNPKARS